METSEAIPNPWQGAPIRVLERTASTMDEALALAREGFPTGTVVCAGYQEKGRGRAPGRSWTSPPWESLLATVVVRAEEICFPLQQLPLRAGVAAALGVEDAAGLRAEIRWPNDLMLGGKKLAGLLCESHGEVSLVGIGVNCAQSAFTPDLADIACSILQARGERVSVFVLLRAVLLRLKQTISDDYWREKLNERLYGRGRRVSVDLLGSGESVEGIAREVDALGRLVLQLAGGRMLQVAQGELRRDP